MHHRRLGNAGDGGYSRSLHKRRQGGARFIGIHALRIHATRAQRPGYIHRGTAQRVVRRAEGCGRAAEAGGRAGRG